MLVGCLVGAVGVICFGLGWYRLGRELTSIAGRLKSDDRSADVVEGKV